MTAAMLRTLQAVCTDAVYAAQEAQRAPDGGAGGEPPARRELRSLQRVAAAAADPMVRLGRSAAGVAARRLGSTSALALTGGVGVLRISVGAHGSASDVRRARPTRGHALSGWTERFIVGHGITDH